MTPTEKKLREALKALVDEIEDLLESNGHLLGNITGPLEAEIKNAKAVLEETQEFCIELEPGLFVKSTNRGVIYTYNKTKAVRTMENAKAYFPHARLVPVDNASGDENEKENTK